MALSIRIGAHQNTNIVTHFELSLLVHFCAELQLLRCSSPFVELGYTPCREPPTTDAAQSIPQTIEAQMKEMNSTLYVLGPLLECDYLFSCLIAHAFPLKRHSRR